MHLTKKKKKKKTGDQESSWLRNTPIISKYFQFICVVLFYIQAMAYHGFILKRTQKWTDEHEDEIRAGPVYLLNPLLMWLYW